MKVCIPTNDRENVEAHFGHCKEFAVFHMDGEKIEKTEYLNPPPHAPGVIPKFLAENGANVIICGGMGQMAVNLFKENNIDVILGAAGSLKENLMGFIQGNLESSGSVCEHHHEHQEG